MNKRDFSARLALVTPDVPDVFHEAMQKTLGSIVAGELNERMSEPARPKRIRRGHAPYAGAGRADCVNPGDGGRGGVPLEGV